MQPGAGESIGIDIAGQHDASLVTGKSNLEGCKSRPVPVTCQDGYTGYIFTSTSSNMTRQVTNIEIVGGHPAVDFVNTVQNWTTRDAQDYLREFTDFLAWNQRLDLLWPKAVKHFESCPVRERQAALGNVRALRSDLHDLFAAMATGERLPQGALDHLNEVIRRTVVWRCLAADPQDACRSLCCLWKFRDAPAYAALGPVAWKAAELLELGETERLKICPAGNCGWLFVDTSKNHSRTWCSMKACGNAAKVRRFRERQKIG